MSDLPTRDSVELATKTYVSDWTELDGDRVCAIVDAYTDGKLMTKAEWWAKLPDGDMLTIDKEHGVNLLVVPVKPEAVVIIDNAQGSYGAKTIVVDGRLFLDMDDDISANFLGPGRYGLLRLGDSKPEENKDSPAMPNHPLY